jgi:hypothetical protein
MNDGTFTLAGGDYLSKVAGIEPASLISLWPLNELSGTVAYDQSGNGRNGTYVNAPTLGQTGIGDGGTAPLFVPASNTRVNIYSASLAAAFNGAEGTLAFWFKARASSVWTDGVGRFQFEITSQTAGNQVRVQKHSVNNALLWVYQAGGVSKSNSINCSATTWQHVAITWSKSANKAFSYLNGTQDGVTQTGLGVWAGALSTTTCLLASDGGAQTWDGYEAFGGLWSTPLSAPQIAALATVP